jgi:phage tail-like protein
MSSMMPFTAFNFLVEIYVGPLVLCSATFSECEGLEMTLEAKTIREGGNNGGPIHLMGPVSFGQLTLRRGMSTDTGIWDWFELIQQQGTTGLRAFGIIAMLNSDRESINALYFLTGCLPVKIKAPALNAKDGLIAVEEIQIAYESLLREV